MQQSSRPTYTLPGQFPLGPKTVVLGAIALIGYGLTRRSKTGTALAAAGGLIAFKAAQAPSPTPAKTRTVLLVNASPEQAYSLWRNFAGLPKFMVHLDSVRELDHGQSEWIAHGPGQKKIRWTAEITQDKANHNIAWRSLPNSDVHTSGAVNFRADPQGRGTFVEVDVQYALPGEPLTSSLAAFFGKHPEFVVREDVRRFKQLLETGEVPTTRGQTHGPRGLHGHTEQVLFREKSNLPAPQLSSAYSGAA